ncbi:MAG TPA: transporter substrate-binding domain-containing protein [Burkholderiales bacterium]
MNRRNAFPWALGALLCAAAFALGGPASARTLAEVKSLGAISMCANADALPWASNKPETPGFQIELGRAIAAGLGVPLNIDWIVPRRRANTVNCDMMLDSVNDPEVNEGRMLLSRPYQKSGMALALRRDAAEISSFTELQKGQKIGVMVNSVASVVLGKAGVTTSPYAFQADMIDDIVKGDLYGGAVSSTWIDHYIHNHPDANLRAAYAFTDNKDLTWDVAIGLRKSDAALQSAVNAVLEKLIADGTLAGIYAKYGVQHRLP